MPTASGVYINQLTGTSQVNGGDLFIIYQSGQTYNVTKDNIGFLDLTGGTINGNLTVTGNTSLQGLTANTFSSSTVYVGSLSTSGSAVCVGSNGLLQQYTPSSGSIIVVGSGNNSTVRFHLLVEDKVTPQVIPTQP